MNITRFTYAHPINVSYELLLFLLLGTGVAMAQLPATMPAGQRQDSSGQAALASQYYDFYFSQQQADHFMEVSQASYTQADQIKRYRFRDRTYTRWVARGFPKPDDFGDYVWIGAGVLSEIKPNGTW